MCLVRLCYNYDGTVAPSSAGLLPFCYDTDHIRIRLSLLIGMTDATRLALLVVDYTFNLIITVSCDSCIS